MRQTVLGALCGAVVAVVIMSGGGGGGHASAQRVPAAAASGELIALPTSAGEGRQMLTLIDPRTRVLSVYQIDGAKGEIVLRGVRNVYWDLQIEEYNGVSPLPSEIRSLIEPR